MGEDMNRIRSLLMNAYSGEGWKKTVKEMSDRQALAIYFRLKRIGRVP